MKSNVKIQIHLKQLNQMVMHKNRGSKAVNKSWLEYKINKSNQGGKQN